MKKPTLDVTKSNLHGMLNMANKLDMERCSHNIRYKDECPACERVWNEAYPPTISKAAYDGAREDLMIWKKRALEAEALIAKYLARCVPNA